MFTGIIDHCGIISNVKKIPDGVQLQIKHSFVELQLGESISVDGICLTVSELSDTIFYCDVSSETLKVTTANKLRVGQSVNLERALQLNSRLGGHFVMGHVDQIATVKNITQRNDFIEMELAGIQSAEKKYIVKKGSITVNGVSLTINEKTETGFIVMLIPHTLAQTNLKNLNEDDAVNIEFDILVRMVAEQQSVYIS